MKETTGWEILVCWHLYFIISNGVVSAEVSSPDLHWCGFPHLGFLGLCVTDKNFMHSYDNVINNIIFF